jgi:hypothetical protein
MNGDWLAMGAVAALAAAGAARRRGSAAVDLSGLHLVEHTERPGPRREPVLWATGVPVSFQFARNTEPSPYFGDKYAQDVEPAGRYVVTLGVDPQHLPPGWIHGDLHFDNPIVLASVWPVELPDGTWGAYAGAEGWKHKLSAAFGGKRGPALTRALVGAGYDGIVTISMSGPRHAPGYVSEIVDLHTMARAKRPRRGGRNPALVRKVQSHLTPDLLDSSRIGTGTGPQAGHCYVASQALWHLLGGKQSGYVPQVGPAPGGGTHWWLRQERTGRILDPTASQFPSYDYAQGTGKGFLTMAPSKRAQVLIDRVRKGVGSRSRAGLHAMKLGPWVARLDAGIGELETAMRQRDRARIIDGVDDVSFWTGRVVCDVLGAAEHDEIDQALLQSAGTSILTGQRLVMAAKTALRKGSGNQTLAARLQWLRLDPRHKAALPVPQVLSELGLEVGDYKRDSWFVLTDDTDAYQVKLEGWGSECVEGMCPAIPDVQRKTAIAEARKLAAQWKRQGWRSGVWTTDDPEVWAITWGVNGPLDHHVADGFDSDDILDVRP